MSVYGKCEQCKSTLLYSTKIKICEDCINLNTIKLLDIKLDVTKVSSSEPVFFNGSWAALTSTNHPKSNGWHVNKHIFGSYIDWLFENYDVVKKTKQD